MEPLQRFSCPACGQRFGWRPEFAGRTVRCKCGASFEARLYGTELAENRPPPIATQRDIAPARAPRVTKLPPRDRRPIGEIASEQADTGPIRDWYVPIALLGIGGAARLTQVLAYGAGAKIGLGQALVLWICELVIGAFAMGMGVLVASQLMEISFGAPGKGAIKLLAMWLIASATAYFVAKIDNDPMNMRGIVLAWHVVLILYFVMFAALFKMDLLEALASTVFITLAQGLLLMGIAKALSPDAARALFFG